MQMTRLRLTYSKIGRGYSEYFPVFYESLCEYSVVHYPTHVKFGPVYSYYSAIMSPYSTTGTINSSNTVAINIGIKIL